jgi:pyruvate formate lyase activating enzyme
MCSKMKIGGFQKVSLLDYPGEIAAVVFCQGCNFRCPYCHNPELFNPELFAGCLSEKSILSFLRNRIGKLDAVTVTGGEPRIQKALPPFFEAA